MPGLGRRPPCAPTSARRCARSPSGRTPPERDAPMTRSLRLAPAFVLALAFGSPCRADLIYDVSAAGSNDSVPSREAAPPTRPFGGHIGNEIPFAGDARILPHAQAVYPRIGPLATSHYTLDLYRPVGSVDPSS